MAIETQHEQNEPGQKSIMESIGLKSSKTSAHVYIAKPLIFPHTDPLK